MEIKVGIAESPRELVLSTPLTQDEVQRLVTEALKGDSGVLAIAADKGQRYLVPANRIAYVAIGSADARRVGFAVGR